MARKSAEEKAVEQQQRAQDQAAAAYWNSPVGQAQQARDAGAVFFQVDIPHSTISGYSNLAFGSGDVRRTVRHGGAPDVLGQIEQLGWQLQHANWVFVETGTSSRDKVMSSGQASSTSGYVVGIYLFRRP